MINISFNETGAFWGKVPKDYNVELQFSNTATYHFQATDLQEIIENKKLGLFGRLESCSNKILFTNDKIKIDLR